MREHNTRRIGRGALCLLAAAAIAGCQKHEPSPLDRAAVEKALTPPSPQVLRVQADALKHPILPATKEDLSEGLSPDGAAVVAVLMNPSLRSARSKRSLADAQILQAGILPDPEFSFGHDLPYSPRGQGLIGAFDLGLNWEMTQLISRPARVKAAQAGRAAVDLDIAWQEWEVAQAAKLAVYKLRSQQERLALSEELFQRLRENTALVRQAVEKRLMTEQDLAAAEAAENQAEAALLDVKKDLRERHYALVQAMGLPADTPVTLRRGIVLPTKLTVPKASELVKDMDQRRLDLVALRRGYDSQDQTLQAAILGQFPKIGIGPRLGRDTGNVKTIGYSASVTLPIFDRNQGVIAQEKATRQQLFDEYVNRVFEARSEIARLVANVESINEQIRVSRAAQPALVRLLETYRKASERGQADLLSYYTAWNNVTSNRLETLSLQTDLVETQIALELAAGLYRLEALRTAPATPGATMREVPK